jgi:hypothetical protein
MYECALLRNEIDRTPVVPIFLADIVPKKLEGEGAASFDFVPVSFNTNKFPDQCHSRSPSGQKMVAELAYPPSFYCLLCVCVYVHAYAWMCVCMDVCVHGCVCVWSQVCMCGNVKNKF